MQLKAQLSKLDYSKYQLFVMFRLRKIWLASFPAAAMFAWLLFPRDYVQRGMSFWSAFGWSSLIAIVLAAIAFPLSLLAIAKLPARASADLGEHIFTLTDAEFQEVNDAGSTTVKLSLLRRYETPHYVFLIAPTGLGYILPMRDLLANPAFLQALRDRTPDKHGN